jgi:hypothetical protein
MLAEACVSIIQLVIRHFLRPLPLTIQNHTITAPTKQAPIIKALVTTAHPPA